VVFDGRDQINVKESAPYPRRFTSIYSLTKKVGEDRVNDAGGSGFTTVILRPKAIFGPGDTTLLPRLLAAARRNRLPQIGDGTNRVDFTYIENAAQAVLSALSAVSGRTYTITNGEPIQLWELIRRVLAHAGCGTQLRRVSISVANAAAYLMEARAAVTGREPLLTRYSVGILARTQTYDLSAARHDLGYAPVVPMEVGIRRTLDSLQRDYTGVNP
jgi:nucleoside-diphosphate-sugar epimerase